MVKIFRTVFSILIWENIFGTTLEIDSMIGNVYSHPLENFISSNCSLLLCSLFTLTNVFALKKFLLVGIKAIYHTWEVSLEPARILYTV